MEKKTQDTVSRHADKYIVRFPAGMRDRIAEAAKANNRSMNAEIVARIEQSFSASTADAGAVDRVLARFLERLQEAGGEVLFRGNHDAQGKKK